jgi:hypothetical protein
MAIFGSMTGVLDTDTSGWSKGLSKATKDMIAFESQGKSFAQNLKAQFGEDSGFGQAFKIAAGSGAVAGLSLAAREFEQFTAKGAGAADAFRKGEATASEFFAEAARGVPVLGNLVKGFDNLREMITGERAAMEAQERAWADVKAGIDAARKARDAFDARGKEGINAFAHEKESASQSAFLAGTPDGIEKELQAIQYETQNRLAKLNEDFAKFASTDAIAALEEKLAAAKQGIEDNASNEAMRKDFEEKRQNIRIQLQALYDNRATLARQYQEIQTAIEAEGYAKSREAQRKAEEQRAKDLADQAKQRNEALAKADEDARKRGEAIAKSLQTPAEKYRAQLADLQEAYNQGSITADIFARGSFKALNEFQPARTGSQLRPVQAEELRGDRFVTAADVGGGQKEANEIARKQLASQLELIGLTKTQIAQAGQDVTISMS